jgi:hypothetical protein
MAPAILIVAAIGTLLAAAPAQAAVLGGSGRDHDDRQRLDGAGVRGRSMGLPRHPGGRPADVLAADHRR